MEPIDAINAEIRKIFELQTANKSIVKQSSAKERIHKLEKVREYVLLHRKELQEAIFEDFHKSSAEVDLMEIYPVLNEIKHTSRHLKTWMKPKKVSAGWTFPGAKCWVRNEPKGVVLIISPWNYPFQLAIDPLISAIAAGNCAILKPSEFSPNTTEFLVKMIRSLFEEKEVAVFKGDYRVSQMLLEYPFNHIFFTGSPQVGKLVMERAARNLSSVTLELGGKSPVIIDSSADLEVAAARITWGKFINAGQICVAPDYVLVPENNRDELIRKIKKYSEQYFGKLEDLHTNNDFCRIINRRHFDRIRQLVDSSVQQGARVEMGGWYRENENYMVPSVLSHVTPQMPVMQEEIFGPVLPVITYRSLEEAIALVNNLPNPLALYIFSRDRRRIGEILNTTAAGDTVVNDVVVHVANVNLPFGGFNNSGIGKSHGVSGFKAFSHERSVLVQSRFPVTPFMYPPYGQRVRRMVNWLMK